MSLEFAGVFRDVGHLCLRTDCSFLAISAHFPRFLTFRWVPLKPKKSDGATTWVYEGIERRLHSSRATALEIPCGGRNRGSDHAGRTETAWDPEVATHTPNGTLGLLRRGWKNCRLIKLTTCQRLPHSNPAQSGFFIGNSGYDLHKFSTVKLCHHVGELQLHHFTTPPAQEHSQRRSRQAARRDLGSVRVRRVVWKG